MSRITDIAVIGGGASGLAAAVEAKNIMPQARVVILEKLDRVGKKLLATGNGRCNLSNINMSSDHYHGSVRNAMRIIMSTPPAKEFFGSLGVICSADPKGRVYHKSNSAATVLSALRLRAAETGVVERIVHRAEEIQSFAVVRVDLFAESEQHQRISVFLLLNSLLSRIPIVGELLLLLYGKGQIHLLLFSR